MLSTTPRRLSRTSKRFPKLTTHSRKGPSFGAALFFARRHCEERSDAAIQEHELDCFASLAMTKIVLVSVLLLAACKDHRPPAPTAEQSQQLNDAEKMLDNMAANEEGPADRSAGPSNSTN